MNTDCRHTLDVPSALSGELTDDEQQAFERHLHDCPQCREAMESHRMLMGGLRALPDGGTGRDLAPLIMERIRRESEVKRLVPTWARVTAAAAALTLLASAAWHYSESTPVSQVPTPVDTAASVARALDFFCASQEADGSWSATKWGGNARLAPALTALPLIALLEGEMTPARALAADRAVRWLQYQQQRDGTFCSDFHGTPFVQGVCTLALLHAYQRRPDINLRATIDAALHAIVSRQREDGGWGYHYALMPDLSITLWNRDVVELASAQGWEEARASHVRSLQWLSSQPTPTASREELVQGNITDFHHAYFAAADLRHQHHPEAQAQLAALRHTLVAHQSAEGTAPGTWAPSDQWSRAGGLIYTTALAALTLR